MDDKKVFGYPEFDFEGEMIVTEYDGAYRDMLMDVRVYRMKPGEKRSFCFNGEETAVLLLSGDISLQWQSNERLVSRESVFTQGPWCVHASQNIEISVKSNSDSEILVQRTKNEKDFGARLYAPEDAPWTYSGKGKFGGTAQRRVSTIFDRDISPESNMVLGEVLNDRGNWSGYLPHRHPQPETYFFKFDHPDGFGASFVGDDVYKSIHNSFSAIPGGALHPQAAAPGFQLYTCWMIRHLDGNPWLQTDRCEDEKFVWLHDAKL